jgi:hypothetical protein
MNLRIATIYSRPIYLQHKTNSPIGTSALPMLSKRRTAAVLCKKFQMHTNRCNLPDSDDVHLSGPSCRLERAVAQSQVTCSVPCSSFDRFSLSFLQGGGLNGLLTGSAGQINGTTPVIR